MPAHVLARGLLEQEARALLTRLRLVRPFALQETMLPAAAPAPAAQLAIERLLVVDRYRLQEELEAYLRWLRTEGRDAPTAEMQRRFTVVRLRFNDTLTRLDLFAELITQRSEHDTGVWLAGLDVLAADAVGLPGGYYDTPPVVCYLARGPGAAIRRARTRLPGGGRNPVAIIRVPRERMIGHGIGSSLVHEAGHQAAALLDLVPSLRPALRAPAGAGPYEQAAWELWRRWIGEVVADFWSVAKLGVGSTLGLMGVISLPRWFVVRLDREDVHPSPLVRVPMSCAIGQALYPDPQWAALAGLWGEMYPSDLDEPRRSLFAALADSLPRLAERLAAHRPPRLRGRSLAEAMPLTERTPDRLLGCFERWRTAPDELRDAPPTLAFAVIGQARAAHRLTPEHESRSVGELLTYWALRSTLEPAALAAPPTRGRLAPVAQPA
jgi:hypothetical protein